MISFPNCKINLGLHITNKRKDGFHDLETVFFPLPFTDVLEIIPSKKNEVEFVATGISVNADETNLCSKAYNLLKQHFPNLPGINMHLHKVIPLGAGLGGGSADAAFTLQLLNKIFKLEISNEQLINYASQLGSDCPFFIINKLCFATGRGEMLEPINVDLTQYKIVIVNPGIHIDTKWAFSKIIPQKPTISIREIINTPIESWKDVLKNAFEAPLFKEYPEIKKLKEDLYKIGAVYASLSGSGSTVYGIFKQDRHIQLPANSKYFYKTIDCG